MKNRSKVIWGIVWIVVGVLVALTWFDVIQIQLFKGWWTLFIIVPGVVGLITERDKTGNFISICIGVGLLLWQQEVFSFDTLIKIAVCIAIFCFGLRLLLRGLFGKNKTGSSRKREFGDSLPGNTRKKYFHLFGGADINLSGERVKELKSIVVFGGCDLDMRDAVLEEDCEIHLTSVFGGNDILLPHNVNWKIESINCFGGVDEQKKHYVGEDAVTVHIYSVCVFGGNNIR